ncbi:hypothetical protein BH11MYX1_BH11MYX1_50670 [soil metagenome]
MRCGPGPRALCALAICVPASAVAAPKMLKGPYLQDLAPTSITVMWEMDEEVPAKLTINGPGGERTIDVGPDHVVEARLDKLAPASRYR